MTALRFPYAPIVEAELDAHGRFMARTVEWSEPRYPGWLRVLILLSAGLAGWALLGAIALMVIGAVR